MPAVITVTVQIKRSLFRDKSTLILREMLRDPDREWKVRDFAEQCRISVGLDFDNCKIKVLYPS